MRFFSKLKKRSTGVEDYSFYQYFESHPKKDLFIFHNWDGSKEILNGKQLAEEVSDVGSILQGKLASQERVILVLPKGSDFVVGLLSCFYSNLVAIPLSNEDFDNDELIIGKIASILNDAKASCIISDKKYISSLLNAEEFSNIHILDIKQLRSKALNYNGRSQKVQRKQMPNDMAVILYTSGSTSGPKGVIHTHFDIWKNSKQIAEMWKMEENSIVVSWLPPSHLFGLELNVLVPIVVGSTSVCIDTNLFLKTPVKWFQYIDYYGATHSGAPNFAFDYCVSNIDILKFGELSLKSLKAMVCAGEAVRKETYDAFYKKFEVLGFNKNCFCPHYGSTEVQAAIAKEPGKPVEFFELDTCELEKGKAVRVEGEGKGRIVACCGIPRPDITIKIVDVDNKRIKGENEIGEIWIKAEGVSPGYFGKQKETEEVFNQYLEETGENGFNRTGDLGFFENEKLYIVGREKDIIIVHGKNFSPIEIERTIKKYLPELTLSTVIFSCEESGREHIILVQELDNAENDNFYIRLESGIKSVVSKYYAIRLDNIVFVKKGEIPRSSIGKIKKKECIKAYQNSKMQVLFQSKRKQIRKSEKELRKKDENFHKSFYENILSKNVDSDMNDVSGETRFSELGLNSLQYMRIIGDIEEYYHVSISPTLFFKVSTIAEFEKYIVKEMKEEIYNNVSYGDAEKESCLVDKDIDEISEAEDLVAIIGFEGCFPGAREVEEFWDNLINGKNTIGRIDQQRPEILSEFKKVYGEEPDDFPQYAGFVDNYNTFDAAFFGISPREAESMDPQQRKALELTWSLIESSGYAPSSLRGKKCGVFVGAHSNDYSELTYFNQNFLKESSAYIDSGLHMSMIANRVSRWFDFHGPSETINTACSSSLVALYHAVQALQNEECDMAVVEGINMIFSPIPFYGTYKAGMLASDGKCKTFDENADGYVRSEGYAGIFIKRLADAQRDGDTIWAVIKRAVINHDGSSSSLRAPNLNSQKNLIIDAYERENVSNVGYIEAHGTGTKLGDPIEITALNEAFLQLNPHISKKSCGIGTVKSNIGHSEACAGIAGVIKVILAINEHMLPGNLNYNRLNPYVPLDAGPFYIVDKNIKWNNKMDKEKLIPLMAGVSSFGFGGTNAHVVIQEYITSENSEKMGNTSDNIIVISAKTENSLSKMTERLLEYLEKHTVNLLDLAYTLQVGRDAMKYRIGFLADSIDEVKNKLHQIINGEDVDCIIRGYSHGEFKHVSQDENILLQLVKEKKYTDFLRMWVEGYSFDFSKLYGTYKRKRLRIPTYAFDEKEYWIPTESFSSERHEEIATKNVKVGEASDNQVISEVDNSVLQRLKKIVFNVLKVPVEDVDEKELLIDLGFDSISLVEFAGILTEEFGMDFTADQFFELTTLLEVCIFIQKQITNLHTDYADKEVECMRKNENMKVPALERANDGISIVGISGRFPDSRNVDELWNIFISGKNVICELPEERKKWWNIKDKIYMGVMPGIAEFDPQFFGIMPREAELMDPRQRLLMEEMWKAIEDAGFNPNDLETQRVAIFVGAEEGDYSKISGKDGGFTNSHNALLASRLAYFLNLHGPNLVINTACSSGLVAFHEACISIRNGESDIAIVGAANLLVTSAVYQDMKDVGMLSASNVCKSFDRDADGMIPGEAVVAIVLQRESLAKAEKRMIYANVLGSGINFDGHTNGITSPSAEAQRTLLQDVYAKYSIEPENIGYIVAHGTGTKLGDPVEINAISKVFSERIKEKKKCAVTSTKANIGHTQAASGLISVICLIKALKKEVIPPSINCNMANEYIRWNDGPLYLNQEVREWNEYENRHIGAVSSFGFSGTNAHVVLENAQTEREDIACIISQTQLPAYILLISAKSEAALKRQVHLIKAYLENRSESSLSLLSISYTLAKGRAHFSYRYAIVVNDVADAICKLTMIQKTGSADNALYNCVSKEFEPNSTTVTQINRVIESLKIETNYNMYVNYLMKLAEYYCSGYTIDINKTWDIQPYFVNLPTYSFDNKEYWPEEDNTEVSLEKISKKIKGEPKDVYFFQEKWMENAIKLEDIENYGTIIVYGDNKYLQQKVTNYLDTEQLNANIIYINNESQIESLKNTYSIGKIDMFIYPINVEEKAFEDSLGKILSVLKMILKKELNIDRLIFIGMFRTAYGRKYLESLIGIQRTNKMFMPQTSISIIAKEIYNNQNKDDEEWSSILKYEICKLTSQTVVYTNGKRYISHVQEVSLKQNQHNKLRENGIYLITGGMGGLGFIFAENLLRNYNANVILVGRKTAEECEDKLKRLRALNKGNIIYEQADICKYRSVEALVERNIRRFGIINGVIHAAGIEERASVANETLEEFYNILEPKIQGTQVLDSVFENKDIDFICYFSSTAAILGDFGGCAYSIGNRYLMANVSVTETQNKKFRQLVINWPLWYSEGMGASDHERSELYLMSSGQRYLQPDEGFKIFELLLSQEESQYMVFVGDEKKIKGFLNLNNNDDEKVWNKNGDVTDLDVSNKLLFDIRNIIANYMKDDENNIDFKANLAAYGFDSISFTNLATMFTDYFGWKVTPDTFYNFPTIIRLRDYLLDKHQEQVNYFYKKKSTATEEIIAQPRDVYEEGKGEIAIIGMSGRFPNAKNIMEFWDFIKNGKCVIENISGKRNGWNGEKEEKRIGAMPSIDQFDPLFFEISPREAEEMDPRQRVLLEECWHALENACLGEEAINKSTIGVFVGAEEGDYDSLVTEEMVTSNSNACLSARIAYLLDFHGPNLTINTACSSGLVALHQACESLRRGECDTAIVAGISLMTTSKTYDGLKRNSLLSPDEKCSVFDQAANGMVPSEAAVVLVLRRLDKAKKEMNRILSTIVADGINFDGKTNGITAPNGEAQQRLYFDIYKRFNVSAKDIGYIVAHGTGTKLGDPIELNALIEALKKLNVPVNNCAITSNKGNIGHSLAASGLVSLVQLITAIKEKLIPPTINFNKPNDYINWENSPIYVNRDLKEWTVIGEKRRLGAVNAFGMTGTNAHIVVKEYLDDDTNMNIQQSKNDAQRQKKYYLFLISAKSSSALRTMLANLSLYLKKKKPEKEYFERISYTLCKCRMHFKERIAIICSDYKELLMLIENVVNGSAAKNVYRGSVPNQFIMDPEEERLINDLAQKYREPGLDISQRELLAQIAYLYCEGYYPEGMFHEMIGIDLPVYPFDDETYWRNDKRPDNHENIVKIAFSGDEDFLIEEDS